MTKQRIHFKIKIDDFEDFWIDAENKKDFQEQLETLKEEFAEYCHRITTNHIYAKFNESEAAQLRELEDLDYFQVEEQKIYLKNIFAILFGEPWRKSSFAPKKRVFFGVFNENEKGMDEVLIPDTLSDEEINQTIANHPKFYWMPLYTEDTVEPIGWINCRYLSGYIPRDAMWEGDMSTSIFEFGANRLAIAGISSEKIRHWMSSYNFRFVKYIVTN